MQQHYVRSVIDQTAGRVRNKSNSRSELRSVHASADSSGSPAAERVADVGPQTEWIPVASLLPADSPRLEGEDADHIRMLAGIDAQLPPITVHRGSMRVIDGMHRLGAAQARGDDLIEVQFFDGPDEDAFVLAVKANIAHGRPLSLADRVTAVERIVASHSAWSDRTIAATSGVSTRTVAEIRRKSAATSEQDGRITARTGRDGRVRPLDHAQGRLKASEIIRDHPDASLRDIARQAGISPATALDVRNRMQRGEDPVPASRRQAHTGSTPRSMPNTTRWSAPEPNLEALLEGLMKDPSLRLTESGRTLLRWVRSRTIQRGEWHSVLDDVPTHCTYVIANLARQCAQEWLQVADTLDRRAERAV